MKNQGFIYLRARYYNPENMRFITEDTYAGRLNDPLTLNLYGYCNGNPILYADPSGHNSHNLQYSPKHERTTSPYFQSKITYYKDAGGKDATSLFISFIPGVGDLKDIQEALTGYDIIIGNKIDKLGRSVTFICVFIPGLSGKSANEILDGLGWVSKGGLEIGQKLLNVGTKSDAIAAVKNLPEAIQSKVKKFYRGGSNAYNNFGVEQLENGNYLVQMTKPGKVPGSYATYFKEITETGETVITYKNTIDPLGNLVHTKIK